MVEPRHVHLVAAKHILRYLKGTIGYGLIYVYDHEINLQGYIDSDWASSAQTGRVHLDVASLWDQL
jgi:hypothetical protein